MPEHLVWYVGYGSNMARERLACYLRGGCPPGGSVTHPGARDPALPREETGVSLPGRLYFADESPVWGGGIAFYDHDAPGPTPAKASLITAGQFSDVVAQENQQAPGSAQPIEPVLSTLHEGERHQAGPGKYETLIHVGRRDGLPMLTFTAPHGVHAAAHAPPSAAYLAMLSAGLHEAHGWDERSIADYLQSRQRRPTQRGTSVQ